jgi:hypothetical protein
MNTGFRIVTTSIVGAWIAAALAGAAWGQARTSADVKSGGDIVRVRDIAGIGNRSLVDTPDASRGRTPPGRWAQIAVDFDTEPEWIDELTFQYCVLCYRKTVKAEEYVLLKGLLYHTDIPKGRGHLSVMYVRPRTLLRYGDVVGVAVTVLHQGEQVAVKSDTLPKLKLPAEWWKHQGLTVKEGYLLSKAQTPFALTAYDDYEPAK